MIDSHDLLEALDAAVYTTDAAGRITFYNSAAATLWGRRPDLGSLWCGSWRIFTPDGKPLPHDQCPMAVALKEGRPVRGIEAIAERPDGTRVPFLPFPTPVRDASGAVTGAINLLVDLTDRQSSDQESQKLAAIVTSSDDAIVGKNLDGQITSWNAGATRIFGYAPEEMIGQSIMRLIPPDLHEEERGILARVARGEQVEHYETTRITKDGRRVTISLTVSPLCDRLGRVVGASKVGRDITERKRAEELQLLLVNELNHRIKNTLATVQAIAGQTLRRAASPEMFVSSFSGRIHALARAHSLLTGNTFQGAELSQLVRDQLQLGGAEDSRIFCSGLPLVLGAQTALHLALVLHELGTNARKYGALSAPSGTVSITWELNVAEENTLLLLWQERGGPNVAAPATRGFGTTLIEQSLKAHGGEVSIRYAEAGVTCSISLPLSEPVQAVVIPAVRPDTAPQLVRSPVHVKLRLQGKRILIVEDEALIAMSLADDVTDLGGTVVGPVANPEAAMRAVAENEFDAAFLDANLSGHPVDAIALALAQKNVPFLFITGYGRAGLPRRFQGATIVQKPFTQEQIVVALERLLDPGPNVVSLAETRAASTPRSINET